MVISFLAMAGIVNHRQLWRFSRWFIVLSVIVGAFLTPPDVISQVMMAVPMAVLYTISIGLAYFLNPESRKERKKQRLARRKAKKSKLTQSSTEYVAADGSDDPEDAPPEPPADDDAKQQE